MAERIKCCVPFCERSSEHDKPTVEWMCPMHWRTVPARLRSLHKRVHTAYDKAKAVHEAISHEGDEFAKVHRGVHVDIMARLHVAANRFEKKRKQLMRTWARCKAAAIETAGGLR